VKIRTQFFVSIVLFGVTVLAVSASVVATNREIERLDAQILRADQVERSASNLSYLSTDFVLHPDAQKRVYWEAQWDGLSVDLSRLEPNDATKAAIIRRMESSHERIGAVFADVARTLEGGPDGVAPSDQFTDISWSRMEVQSRGLSSDALQLTRILREDSTDAARRSTLLSGALVGAFALYFLANYVLISRRALHDVSELAKGTSIIGSGNLDHKIPVKRKDEIGTLAVAFNAMTADLKDVTASKADLEREVTTRERAERAARQELETSDILLQTARSLAQHADLESIASALLDAIERAAACAHVSIGVWEPRRSEIRIVAAGIDSPLATGRVIDLFDMPPKIQEALGTGRIVVIDSAVDLADMRHFIGSVEGASIGVVVPTMYQRQAIGVFFIGGREDCRPLELREVRILEGLASHAASSFARAQLFQAEHRIAETLQAALLEMPDSIPGVEFSHLYQSAAEAAKVGGDFYDIFELQRDRLAITVGDISGKGLDAAALTSLVKNTIRAKAIEEGATPDLVLDAANRVLFRSSSSEVFATVFFAILDLEGGQMAYCNAAHTTTAVIQTSGTVAPLGPTSPLVGAFDDVTFIESHTTLGPGDVLFLYTDGLTEAPFGTSRFGEQRLFELLSNIGTVEPVEVVRRVGDTLVEITGGSAQDDVAILALRLRYTDATDGGPGAGAGDHPTEDPA